MRTTLDNLCSGNNLSRQESLALFSRIVRGELSELEICAVLVALKSKGETPEEIAGAAEALVTSAMPLNIGELSVADTCGTGGDGVGTVNISTAAALVAAEAGLAVAKHGNRSITSQCGSADVLEKCGVQIEGGPEVAARTLKEVGICFLFAPKYHTGMRHAMPVRRALGVRTIFNLLGPLANPARPRWQIVGVYDPNLCVPLAKTLGLLGCTSALVVHGSGIDEIAPHGPTQAALLRTGQVEQLVIEPEQAGMKRISIDEIRGGDTSENAQWLFTVLSGKGSRAHTQSVALNVGALLWITEKAPSFKAGVLQAEEIINSGRAAERLRRFAECSRGP
jgi:anthranilate phosphoribosyltransferase